MSRYKVTIEYHGSGFVGWQRQKNGPSVQQAVEEAIYRFSGEAVNVFAAGRTDAGVHALGQVAHFDIERHSSPRTVRDAINFYLKPAKVVVVNAEAVPQDFHARFSARERSYLYRITNRRAPLALERGRTWWVPTPLDEALMADAARHLLGHHDFTSFRASNCQATSPVRTLDALDVFREGDEIHVRARARSFLHHQVRSMAGTLKLVGEGKWTADTVRTALEACDRSLAGPTAPAEGLYLTEVKY